MQQQHQQMQALNAACQHYEQQIKQLEFEKAAKVVDNQAKADIRKMELEVDLAKAEITTKAQSASERAGFVQDVAMQIMSFSHDRAIAAQQAAHAQMAQQQQLEAQSQQAAPEAQEQAPEQPQEITQ
jgi:heme-binding NEAT domain protein